MMENLCFGVFKLTDVSMIILVYYPLDTHEVYNTLCVTCEQRS